jgi:6-phosphogluconolactonase (cycloisomerase 2 family)
MGIKLRGFVGLGAIAALATLLLNCGASSRPAGVLVASSQGATLIQSYGVNLNTGVLSQINTAGQVPSGTQPSAVIMDPAGAFAYVINTPTSNPSTTPGKIAAYAVNSDGTVTSSGSGATTGLGPVALAMDPAGKFLLAVNQTSNNVSVYTIGSSASLTEVAGSPFPTGVPQSATVTSPPIPSAATVTAGGYVYVTNQGQDSLSGFSLNSSGVLTPLPGLPTNVGLAPSGVISVVTPSGTRVLFVANQGDNNVSSFEINSDGTLTPSPGSPFASGLAPTAMAIEPTHNFLYVNDLNSNQITPFRINPGDGSLTAGNVASTGSSPTAIAIHPDGLYLYTANVASDNISEFRINLQTGALSPIATATSQSRPAGLAVK